MNEVKKVFISYAREDKDIARRLYQDFLAAGAAPWLDEECLLPGQRWKAAISAAIRESDFFVALLSVRSVSKRGYVQKELREALELLEQSPEGEIYVIPARLNECRPTHERLLELNWVDLFPDYKSGLRRLLLVVRPRLEVSTGRLRSAVIVDREALEETGWAVIFTEDTPLESREALRPLLEYRRHQAGQHYSELTFERGESKERFLAKHGSGPGPADPGRVPYYLLLVGDPEAIPFKVQYQLGLQYRVGRLDFDSADHLQNYAIAAIESERSVTKRIGTFFGASHFGDKASNLAVSRLVEPLADYVSQSFTSWEVRLVKNEGATKERLNSELANAQRAAFWFIVSHGLGFHSGHQRQKLHQGSIICSNWEGRHRPVKNESLFTVDDLPQNIDLRGTIFFYFGSYSAGTARVNGLEQFTTAWGVPIEQAPLDFVSGLAKGLLGRKNGALGFIGHVNEAWSTSFQWRSVGPQTQVFESALRHLVEADRLGAALAPFSQRYAELSSDLSLAMLSQQPADTGDAEHDLAMLRKAVIDARNYILLGDPAAKVRFEEGE